MNLDEACQYMNLDGSLDTMSDREVLGDLWHDIFHRFDLREGGQRSGRIAQAAVDAMEAVLKGRAA